jgi:pimeloyl-ACP methyl ester carboxylesterase
MLALLDHLAIGKAAFIGTSMGGSITMALAAMAPSRMQAAVLNDVGPEIDPAGLKSRERHSVWSMAVLIARDATGADLAGRVGSLGPGT